MLAALMQSTFDVLLDTGEHEEVLTLAAEMVPRLEASGDVFDFNAVRAGEARILAMRGQAAQVAAGLDWLQASSKGLGSPEDIVMGLGSAAMARAGLRHDETASSLLMEVEAFPGPRDTPCYPALLPAMVRTALGIGNAELAERLVSGVELRSLYAEHALVRRTRLSSMW